MKTIFKVVISILLVFILAISSGIFYLTRGLNENIELASINLSNLNNVIYNGKYKAGRWTNELQITVEDHKIIEIKILDDVTFVKPLVSDKLFSNVIAAQSTNVDTVSQATITSNAYLKAIENSLNRQ